MNAVREHHRRQEVRLPAADLVFITEPITELGSLAPHGAELLARVRTGGGFERWAGADWSHLARSVTTHALASGLPLLDSGPGVLHVNITALDLCAAGFAWEVLEATRGSDRARLVLECTEHFPITDEHVARESLAALRGAGVRIALDDFGEQWANLDALRVIRPEILKVTRPTLESWSDPDAVADWFLELAHGLEVDTTIIEQIETAEQLAWATARGFTCAQGHLAALSDDDREPAPTRTRRPSRAE
ncbi:MAG: diguanylate cyclase/phosphodiesterase [Ilumatobacteraceae bacterium]|nr:diguanylate cyclase/phosphodiesterase [Ilumatobacteraceae bacterium]